MIKFINNLTKFELEKIDLENSSSTVENVFTRKITELRNENKSIYELLQNCGARLCSLADVALHYKNAINLGTSKLLCISFLYALWLRFCIGYTDSWIEQEKPEDEAFKQIEWMILQTHLGAKYDELFQIKDCLSVNDNIWGVNLIVAKLDTSVYNNYARMMRYQGAIKDCLNDLLLWYSNYK